MWFEVRISPFSFEFGHPTDIELARYRQFTEISNRRLFIEVKYFGFHFSLLGHC